MKKKILILFLLSLILLPLTTNAIVKRSDKKYVTDQARILKEESENYIVKYSDFLYKAKKIDYYVVTVKSLEDLTLEEYTDELYRKFKLKEKGLLILIAKDERKIRIQSGKDLAKIINGDVIDEYIDTYFIPYMERDQWNEGIINGYSAFYKKICEAYGIDASEMQVIDKLDFLTKYKTPIAFVIIWLSIMAANYFCKYYKKLKKSKDPASSPEAQNTIIFGMVVIGNIFLLAGAYILEPIYLLFTLAFEGVTVYSSLSTAKKINIPKEEKQVQKQQPVKKQVMVKKKPNKLNYEYKRQRAKLKRKEKRNH